MHVWSSSSATRHASVFECLTEAVPTIVRTILVWIVLLPPSALAQTVPFNDKWGKLAGYTVTNGNKTSAYSKDWELWGTVVVRNGQYTHYDSKGRLWRVREVAIPAR